MKRCLFLAFSVFLGLMVYMSEYHRNDQHSWPQILERAMALTPMQEYHDDDYDYTLRYPAFFQRDDDTLLDKGTSRFTFWRDNTEIVLTAFLEHNSDMLTAQQAVKKYTSSLHATHQHVGKDFFILSGPLHNDSGKISGRRFHAKFVKHRKFWFVQSLTYPEDCEQALQRLLHEIDAWQVWKK